MARVNEGSHSFTCHRHVYPQVEWAIPAFTPQPQSVSVLWPVLISCPAKGRRLSWPRWLGEILRRLARPTMAIHLSTSHNGRGSNSQPSSRESDALTTRPQQNCTKSVTFCIFVTQYICLWAGQLLLYSFYVFHNYFFNQLEIGLYSAWWKENVLTAQQRSTVEFSTDDYNSPYLTATFRVILRVTTSRKHKFLDVSLTLPITCRRTDPSFSPTNETDGIYDDFMHLKTTCLVIPWDCCKHEQWQNNNNEENKITSK